jgi:hypothetical protein
MKAPSYGASFLSKFRIRGPSKLFLYATPDFGDTPAADARHSLFANGERREALLKWEQYVLGLVYPSSKVVPLRAQGAFERCKATPFPIRIASEPRKVCLMALKRRDRF